MARFTDSDKWKDVWFRKLQPAEKLVWLYLIDTCDNAGFFEYDPEMIAFFTGMPIDNVTKAFKGLSRGMQEASDKSEYYITNFLKHQKNLPLNEVNNAHRQIIRMIEDKKEKFPSVYDTYLGPNKGLISPIGKGKVKVKVEYSSSFNEWWAVYKTGSKQNAFKAWKGMHLKASDTPMLIDAVKQYKDYCLSIDRPFKDGQGWINGRFWETTWTHEAQGTKATVAEAPHYD